MTLPVILAYDHAQQKGDKNALDFWRRVISEHNQSSGDLETATDLLKQENALEATLDAAREHIKTAKSALDIFPESPWKTALKRLADFVVQRVS